MYCHLADKINVSFTAPRTATARRGWPRRTPGVSIVFPDDERTLHGNQVFDPRRRTRLQIPRLAPDGTYSGSGCRWVIASVTASTPGRVERTGKYRPSDHGPNRSA